MSKKRKNKNAFGEGNQAAPAEGMVVINKQTKQTSIWQKLATIVSNLKELQKCGYRNIKTPNLPKKLEY